MYYQDPYRQPVINPASGGNPYGATPAPMMPGVPGMPGMPTPAPAGYPGSPGMPSGFPGGPGGDAGPEDFVEQSYIENILRFNRGRVATFYMTHPDNNKWNAMIFTGRIETAGRDHIIISDPNNPETGQRRLLLMNNLDWVDFNGPIAYVAPTLPPEVAQQLTTGLKTPVRDQE